MKKTPNPETTLLQLQSLCARSEQCSFDIGRKLFAKGFSQKQSDEIITKLIDDRFIDDMRYAKAFVHDKYLFQRWGRQKIIAALIAKRFKMPDIRQALNGIDGHQYLLNALHVMHAKAKSLGEESQSAQGKNKILRHAISRGYEYALAIKIIQSGKLWPDSQQ